MKALSKVCLVTMTTRLMKIKKIAPHGVTHPFGDHRSVHQAFPAAIDTTEADPFLMCDYFNMVETKGPVSHPDDFPVDWHPHRGFDIASYLRSGTGRHGDSLGNRETYSTPGMQWMSTGSGVEHAEGGASQKGERVEGFQIWIKVSHSRKLQPPRYGTVPTEQLPLVSLNDKVQARVLAGKLLQDETTKGPFETSQPVQMIDFEVSQGGHVSFDVTLGLDTAMLYVYEGTLTINESSVAQQGSVVLFQVYSSDNEPDERGISLTANHDVDGKALLFAGKKLHEPIAWHGPIVMNTQDQIHSTLKELRSGCFPPVRVDWDYKRIASKPNNADK